MEESKENFKKIKSANQMMLDYFNKSFLSQLEDIQNLKTQIFEIDIKIDELDKTKDIYAFKTNSRKSVFSPVTNDGVDTERNKIIQEQIKDLQSVKETLTLKLRGMELQLNKLRQYLEALNNAEDALTSFEPRYTTDDPDHTDHYGFTFLQEDAKEDISSHGYNILMLDAYDRALTQTILDKQIKTGLEAMQNKLDMINYLIGTDVGRAKLNANASNVSVQASLTPNMAEVILTDDGVGIKDTYMEDSPWYSSLHKAKEILYMLCGKLDISGDVMSGTTVKFSFPIQP